MERRSINQDVYNDIVAEILADLELVLDNKQISGIRLYSNIYNIVKIKSYAINLYKILYKFLTNFCIKKSIKIKNEIDQCIGYTHEFMIYKELVRVLKELFTPLDEIIVHLLSDEGDKYAFFRNSISTDAIRIFVDKVIINTGIIDLFNLILQQELKEILSKVNFINFNINLNPTFDNLNEKLNNDIHSSSNINSNFKVKLKSTDDLNIKVKNLTTDNLDSSINIRKNASSIQKSNNVNNLTENNIKNSSNNNINIINMNIVKLIQEIKIEKLPKEYSILLIYNSIIFDEINQKNSKLIMGLNTLREFNIYKNLFENYAIINIKYYITNIIKQSSKYSEFVRNSCLFYKAIKSNLSKILLKESFIKVIKILDEELIFNNKNRITEPLIYKLLIQINNYINNGSFITNSGVFVNDTNLLITNPHDYKYTDSNSNNPDIIIRDEMFIEELFIFPYFNIIVEEIILKLIMYNKINNIYDGYKYYIIFKKINSVFLLNKYERTIRNGFSYLINQFNNAEEEFVIHIHRILLGIRNDQQYSHLFSFNMTNNINNCNNINNINNNSNNINSNTNNCNNSNSNNRLKNMFFNKAEWKIIDDLLILVDKIQDFYDKYIFYLEKRLLIGEIVFEKEVINHINLLIPNYNFSTKAYKMIEEIEKCIYNDIFYNTNPISGNTNYQFNIQFLLLNEINFTIPNKIDLEIPDFLLSIHNEVIKYLPENKKYKYNLFNDYCLVKIDNKVVQMTLLHYLILNNYPLNIPSIFIGQLKEQLRNINSMEILELPIIEKQEEKDFFLICKSSLLNLLKKEKIIKKDGLKYRIKYDTLENVLEECINQGYIKQSGDVYEYIP